MNEEQALRIVVVGLVLGAISYFAPAIRSLLGQLIHPRRQRQRGTAVQNLGERDGPARPPGQ